MLEKKRKDSLASDGKLTEEQQAQLVASDGRHINTADIPEAPEQNWAHARKFCKPRKEAISLRLDADTTS